MHPNEKSKPVRLSIFDKNWRQIVIKFKIIFQCLNISYDMIDSTVPGQCGRSETLKMDDSESGRRTVQSRDFLTAYHNHPFQSMTVHFKSKLSTFILSDRSLWTCLFYLIWNNERDLLTRRLMTHLILTNMFLMLGHFVS